MRADTRADKRADTCTHTKVLDTLVRSTDARYGCPNGIWSTEKKVIRPSQQYQCTPFAPLIVSPVPL